MKKIIITAETEHGVYHTAAFEAHECKSAKAMLAVIRQKWAESARINIGPFDEARIKILHITIF